MRHIAMELAAL